ncbi:hypothetical protein LCGC14_1202780 [marine sediment metagenome]|uniref:Uncharacterized protein n=1 Tax=marine sediment metagenome TaxID=412755 RepID=A0A0F9NYS8_9ZZZZ
MSILLTQYPIKGKTQSLGKYAEEVAKGVVDYIVTNPRLREDIAGYLTKQFVWTEVDEMPKDECYSEAD